MTPAAEMPAEFRRAVAAFRQVTSRPELALAQAEPPRRLAPWAFALRAEVGEAVVGRLVLLHDPATQPDWEGTFRLVCYVSAELDPEQAADEALPSVVWSWLTEALSEHDAGHRALRGTVTRTSSMRFGDTLASGNGAGALGARSDDVELRCSWTPDGTAGEPAPGWAQHAAAFVTLLGTAAGLPPVGVSDLGQHARLTAGNP